MQSTHAVAILLALPTVSGARRGSGAPRDCYADAASCVDDGGTDHGYVIDDLALPADAGVWILVDSDPSPTPCAGATCGQHLHSGAWNPGVDGANDAVSLAVGFTATTATFPVP